MTILAEAAQVDGVSVAIIIIAAIFLISTSGKGKK